MLYAVNNIAEKMVNYIVWICNFTYPTELKFIKFSLPGEKEALFDITQEIEGAVAKLPDDLDIDKDGNIYWSDASAVSHLCDSLTEVLSDPSGRLV